MITKKGEDLPQGPRSKELISYLNGIEIFFLKGLILGGFAIFALSEWIK